MEAMDGSKIFTFGGLLSCTDSVLASHPMPPGSTIGAPNNFSLDVAEIY